MPVNPVHLLSVYWFDSPKSLQELVRWGVKTKGNYRRWCTIKCFWWNRTLQTHRRMFSREFRFDAVRLVRCATC